MNKNKLSFLNFLLAGVILILPPSKSFACDPNVLIPTSMHAHSHDAPLKLFLQEQYTSLVEADSSEANSIKNGELVRDFLTNQINLSYSLNDSFSVMLAVPYIVRGYYDVKNFSREYKVDSGIGDISALGYYADTILSSEDFSASYSLYGGVKTPTGDTGSIGQASNNITTKHHVIPSSASAGRILTFGTGSYDFPLGAGVFLESGRFITPLSFQYTFKTEGSFNYKFADDIIFYAAPGVNVLSSEEFSMSLHYMMSGEFKNADTLSGKKVSESAYSNLFMGPSTIIKLGNNFGAEISYLFRSTSADNSILVPENRIRLNLGYSF